MDQPPEHEQGDGEDREAEVEERLVAAQVDARHTEVEDRADDVLQPVFTAGDAVPLDRDEPEHLAEGDGEEGEVDAALVRHAGADEGAEHRRDEHRAGQVEPQVGEDALLQQAEGVSASPEEGAVTERRQAGGAEHQVVAEREQHPDHHFEGEVLVQADAGEPERRGRQREQQQQHRQRQETGTGRGGVHQRRAAKGRENSDTKWVDSPECTF